MRRLVLLTAGIAALACAGRTRPPVTTAPPPAAASPSVPGLEPQPGEVLSEFDINRDGRPDVWKFVLTDRDGKETLVRKEKDLNGDARVDAWEGYGPDGTITKLVYDLDFDGRPDVTLTFEKEQLVSKEYALGFDGVSRSTSFFEKGKLVRKERDTNSDGKVDYWEYWEGGEIDRIGQDLDGDGQVDRWEAKKVGEDAAQAAAQK